jgi:acyl-CoA synthetase (AMP-forming)/AMP-acid ligase II
VSQTPSQTPAQTGAQTGARARPTRRADGGIALIDERGARTWTEVEQTLHRAANAFLDLGECGELGPDRRVTVFAENSAETALAHLGALLGGVSTVPASFHLTVDELAYVLEDSGSTAVLTGPETAEIAVAAARRAGIDRVLAWRTEATTGAESWEDFLAGAPASAPPDDLAPRPHLLYTSGTTGRPKGTELPPTMFAGGSTMREHLARLAENPFAAFGTHLVVGPMYHTGPLTGMRLLVAGIPIVILGRFDPEATLGAIEHYGVESSVMVPTHFARMLALPDDTRARYDVSSLGLVVHTGSACPVDVKRRMIEWWGPVLFEAYGATEVGTTCMITSQEWLAHPGSVGRAIPPFEVRVLDDEGDACAPNVEGRLCFLDTTGRGVVYHNDPGKSADAHVEPGVFTLGEIGFIDEDGYVFITDRTSDMVVSGGVNLYPAEVEAVLIEHPEVADVAVIGIPDPDMGEALRALVVPVDAARPPSDDELITFCRDRIAHHKCPRSVELVATLDRSAMGKVNKRALRAPYWPTERTIG